MTFAYSDIPEQTGRTAIVTGANTGIGLEIARGLARKGARVLLACRDADKANEAIEDIRSGPERADLAFLHLDLANIASVRQAAEEASHEERIDLLIDNAGVMMPPLDHATAGCELQFAMACHPGIAQTEITRHFGPLGSVFGSVVGLALNSAADGALPALQAATDPAAEGGEYYGPYGFREMSGKRSGRAIASTKAKDEALAKRLWDRSVELTGVDPDLAPA